ncbi:MAG: hypothetical protein CMH63_01445 [Nanoarchaeota archaeon]|nr:hypothetical protein [Nanoarchaeota archaeon]
MVATEIVVTTILKIIFSVILAYVAIAFILPMIRALVKEIIEEPSAVSGFMSLLVIVVYVFLFKEIIKILTSLPVDAPAEGAEASKPLLSYLSVLEPGIGILDQLLPYVGWVLLGSLIAFGLRHYFKK